jgi:hypothetical protein
MAATRYPGDRLREIEKEARGLVAAYNEFVGGVTDTRGTSMKGEMDEWVAQLERALRPLPPPQVPHYRDR